MTVFIHDGISEKLKSICFYNKKSTSKSLHYCEKTNTLRTKDK